MAKRIGKAILGNVLDTDSYKASHYLQLPPGLSSVYSYFESRGGRYGSTLFFGLQYLLKEYFSDPVTKEEVDYAREFYEGKHEGDPNAHGEPFNYAGWMRVVERHNGMLPLKIKAVAEGTIVPTKNALFSVQTLDSELPWLGGWMETQIVRNWYPTTVATQGYYWKKKIFDYLVRTSDNPAAEILFKLHDFGGRGVTCREQAGIGGMAHTVNFRGSDTCAGIVYANEYYNCPMSAWSIPAAEHSTIILWGREREHEAYRNMVKQFAKPGKMFACVSDSYNLWDVIENVWCGELRDEIAQSGATLVARPDSGTPHEVVLKALQTFERKIGAPKNFTGYRVLPKWMRLIQGDGIDDEDALEEILSTMEKHNYSATNIAFGSGGGLLQRVNRDTQKIAFKPSWAMLDGKEIKVSKDPIDDPTKRSKAGKQSLIIRDGNFQTVEGDLKESCLEDVWETGKLIRDQDLESVRKNASREFV